MAAAPWGPPNDWVANPPLPCYIPDMFPILEKIDKALESKAKCTLMDKSGRTLHGTMSESWVRISGGKLRGKVVFNSEEKGEVEIDCNDLLDVVIKE